MSQPAEPHLRTDQDSDVILVPIDLSDQAADVLAFAVRLGARLGATVLPMHVYTLPQHGYPGADPLLSVEVLERFARAAEDAAEAFTAARDAPEPVVREGDPATEILRAIGEVRPILVVMGTHGRGGLPRLLLGSVAEKVIRQSPAPVLTIPPRTLVSSAS